MISDCTASVSQKRMPVRYTAQGCTGYCPRYRSSTSLWRGTWYFISPEFSAAGVPNPRAADWYLLRTRPHSRRWAAGEWAKLHLPPPVPPHRPPSLPVTAWTIGPNPRPWKNCLPRRRSLVPGRLGSAAWSWAWGTTSSFSAFVTSRFYSYFLIFHLRFLRWASSLYPWNS